MFVVSSRYVSAKGGFGIAAPLRFSGLFSCFLVPRYIYIVGFLWIVLLVRLLCILVVFSIGSAIAMRSVVTSCISFRGGFFVSSGDMIFVFF